VPRPLADKILAARGRIEGERRQVTVLFCDLADSTRVAEHLGAEVYRQLLDEYLGETLRSVYRYEGVVSSLAGDGFMAIFGAPVAHDDDAARACRAALDVLTEVRLLSRRWHDRVGQPVAARIGINTGPVVVGTVGTDLRMDYTAIGDTTNVASRIEAFAPPGEACLSQATRRLIAHDFETEEVATEAFKGKREATTVFRLVRAIPRRERRHHALRGGLNRFLGRHTEVALLRERYDEARAGAGRVVFVAGEAGIGKSRLIHEFRRQLDADSYHWLEGQCVSYGTGSSYLPIIDVLRGIFEIDEGDGVEAVIAKVHGHCAALGGPAAAGEPFFRDLLAVDPGDERLARMQELHKVGFIFESVRDLAHALARQKPVVLLLEDVHWIDQSSEQLLRRLFETLAGARVLAVVTHRSEYAWPHGERSYFSRVRLHGLPPSLVDELACTVLGCDDLPPALKRVVAERSDGNPFFVEEVAKALGERGVLDAPPSDTRLLEEVPATVQEVILARIDRLPDEAKRTLQVAAVIGREFTLRVLERAAERAGDVVCELSGLELIYEKASHPELAYMFKHALTHDVAYQTLLERERRELHGKIARLIEELYADRLPEFYETLAYQYERADVPERAAHYALLSGERAAKHLAPEAEDHFRRAARLSQGRDGCGDMFVEAQAELGDLVMRRGDVDAANDAYARAMETTRDPARLRWLRNKVSHRHFVERDGVRLAYYVHGEGAGGDPQGVVPIVCFHPMIQGSYAFQDLAQRLCQEHCVVYTDARGLGASDKPEEPYDFDVRVEDALAVLRQLPYERFVLQADSDGVRVALRLYHAMPERIAKLILFGFSVVGRFAADNPLGLSEDEVAMLDEVFLKPDYGTVLASFFGLVANEPGMSAWREVLIDTWSSQFDEDTVKRFLGDALLADERLLLPGVGVPTLVIAAENDVARIERVRYMAEHIPGAKFALIKHASHMAPWTAVETFTELLTTFVATGTIPREVWEP
jgi:class 3 adenylate cyclase/pimeloyl-ACP methyl ester carboxylesterase